MLKKSFLLLALLGLLCFPQAKARADAATKQEKLNQLSQMLGLTEMFDTMKSNLRPRLEGIFEPYRQMLVKQLSDVPEGPKKTAALQGFDNAAKKSIEVYLEALNSQDLEKIYMSAYGNGLSEEDLDQSIKYYQSEVGKKDIVAAKAAAKQMHNYISQKLSESIPKFKDTLHTEFQKSLDEVKAQP